MGEFLIPKVGLSYMADSKKPANVKDDKAPSKTGSGKLRFYTIMTLVGFCTPFMLPTVVLLLVGFIPTIVAFFVDKDRQHSSATAIGAMNLAGITPFVIDLWIKGQSMGSVFQILSQSTSWLIIFGAAALYGALV